MKSLTDVEPRVIGWTGSPGSGKSSLITRVVALRRRSHPKSRIAILAVDPTSAMTGGSVLGDRIRMDELALEDGVYIRSLAARGGSGALAPAVMRIARFLAASGFTEIHVETVGAGQSDVLIRSFADLTILVVSPQAGDAIQGLKAGILEIADIFVVNKSDLDGAPAAAVALETAVFADRDAPPVVLASAKENHGVEDVARAIDERFARHEKGSRAGERRAARREAEFRAQVIEEMTKRSAEWSGYVRHAEEVRRGRQTPWAAAEAFLREIDVRCGKSER